jgi:GH15 family glucan-1,4-alpha-glucosidase
VPYQISVVRYFGAGLEESDWNADGPNIEWDGFGMFLDGLDAYERAKGDLTLAMTHWPSIFTRVANVLVSLATDDGLLRADSSIWETHWDNGGRQHWTWSQVWGVVGLRAAAAIATRHGHPALAERWTQVSGQIRSAILSKLVDPDGFLRGRLETTPTPEDAAVVEAFLSRVLEPSGPSARETLARLVSKLRVESGHGFRRNLGPSEYDAREWVFVDLRLATLLRWTGAVAEADALLGWVTAQSRANHDLIAENYDPATAAYLGAVPMIGFGAGAYVLALFARNDPESVLVR